jgi:hypothetical protein
MERKTMKEFNISAGQLTQFVETIDTQLAEWAIKHEMPPQVLSAVIIGRLKVMTDFVSGEGIFEELLSHLGSVKIEKETQTRVH